MTIQEMQPSKGWFCALHNTARHKTIKNGMSIGHGFEEKWGGEGGEVEWEKKLLTTIYFIKKWLKLA